MATHAIHQSIELRDNSGDDRYYLDFYKLNKLLYLAQGKMLAEKDCTLFKEDIYAYTCGPYIKELEFVFKEWEFAPITKPYQQEFVLPASVADFVNKFFKEYGKYDKQELGIATKNQEPWKKFYKEGKEPEIIEQQIIKDYFSKINNLHMEIKNDFS